MPLEFGTNEVVLRELTKRQRKAIYRPYAVALGDLIWSWNHLHEALALLFLKVVEAKSSTVALSIWHSTPSDLNQRKMLRAAIGSEAHHLSAEIKTEIKWLLDRVDQALSGSRNDAIHAPLAFFTNPNGTHITPFTFFSNPRAESLKGKDLLMELAWHLARMDTLRGYAGVLSTHLTNPTRYPLSARPKLPNLGEQKIAKRNPLVGRGKVRRLRIQSPPQ